MLPVIRKMIVHPSYTNDFFGRDLVANFFNDGADYTVPAVNIKETEKQFELEIAAPGFSKNEFDINMEKNVLTISSKKEEQKESEDQKFARREFGFKSFRRTFSVPDSVDVEKIKASYKNGILKIELPKQEEDKLKNKLQIKIS